jgi:hypothetical protein
MPIHVAGMQWSGARGGGITEDDRGEKNNENEKCEFYTLLKIF